MDFGNTFDRFFRALDSCLVFFELSENLPNQI